MYQCIIFDVDGTLIDTERVIIRALQRVLEKRGHRVEGQDLSFAVGIPGDASLSRLGVVDREASLREWNDHIQSLSGEIRLFDGIRDLIERLEEKGLKKGIVTSKTREELSDDFGPFGMMHYFPYRVCVDEVTFHKPHPEPLLRCLELASCAPEEALFVGDTIYDSECARDSGVDFALALWGVQQGMTIPSDIALIHPLDLLNLVEMPGLEHPAGKVEYK
ncbi:MAG TPA: HAD family hydrolase [Atribacteraceae bacterium]|nr:HAD family hydrolase [Atribacteraceae bacterium]